LTAISEDRSQRVSQALLLKDEGFLHGGSPGRLLRRAVSNLPCAFFFFFFQKVLEYNPKKDVAAMDWPRVRNCLIELNECKESPNSGRTKALETISQRAGIGWPAKAVALARQGDLQGRAPIVPRTPAMERAGEIRPVRPGWRAEDVMPWPERSGAPGLLF